MRLLKAAGRALAVMAFFVAFIGAMTGIVVWFSYAMSKGGFVALAFWISLAFVVLTMLFYDAHG